MRPMWLWYHVYQWVLVAYVHWPEYERGYAIVDNPILIVLVKVLVLLCTQERRACADEAWKLCLGTGGSCYADKEAVCLEDYKLCSDPTVTKLRK